MKKHIIALVTLASCLGIGSEAADTPSATDYEPYHIGELGELWQFPSDHLPIGATLESFHIALWNVLNKKYLHFIEENTQGLKNSSILKCNVPVCQNGSFTVREMMIAAQIFEMISHPTHPRSLIALQETHVDLLNFLKTNLPSSWVILTPPDQPNSQDIFLFDADIFEAVNLAAVKYSPLFTIFNVTLREKTSGKLFHFIQSHIPGGAINSPVGCAKFSGEALRQYDKDLTIVLMGDMNQSPAVIERALCKTAEALGISQPYHHLPVPYPTHMNTRLQASWTDHFFISTPENHDIIIKASDNPEELFNELVPIIKLLTNKN